MLGISSTPVLVGEHREPLWPYGIVGSISHKNDKAVAAVTWFSNASGIGIDLESLTEPVSPEIIPLICTNGEKEWVLKNQSDVDVRIKMIFSAKEAAFKAFFPVQKIYLDYHDVQFVWHSEKACFMGFLRKRASEYHPIGFSFEVGCKMIEKFLLSYLIIPPVSELHEYS